MKAQHERFTDDFPITVLVPGTAPPNTRSLDMTALTNQRTVNPEQRPGEQPKRLTVWFGPQDAAAVKEVFDEARSDPYATKINVKVRVEDSGTDLLSGMEWVSYIISNSHYTEAVRKRLRRRSQFIRVEVMSADIIVGGNRDAPK